MALQQVSSEQASYWMAFPMSSPSLVDAMCSPKGKSGELSMSGDDAPVKVRKPYTITKQRERWTEDEHQKFLDALKLHGRAWRRIEEHIGTKTAVQIRSHAQKFFSKLEREASLNGSSTVSGSGEIEIPPPRPKRKPSHPYPKKALCAFSGSLSLEEDCKSPPAVHSAFAPLENSTGIRTPKKNESSAATLRLFGQTFASAIDKVEPDPELMESTGSPRSQISVETEETTGISPFVASVASDAQDQHGSVNKPHELAGAESGTNSQLCKAMAEWETGYITPAINHSDENNASLAYECRPRLDASCYMPWQPSSYALGGHNPLAQFSVGTPTFWQGSVPSNFAHDSSNDMNAAAAIAAATYAVASAWQAIQGAFASASNEQSMVYNPIAMIAAARDQPPIPLSRPEAPVVYAHEQAKRKKQGGRSSESGDEDEEGNSIHGEESTAECCSGLTDSSRLSSYESSDEGIPAKKCCRRCNDSGVYPDRKTHVSESVSISERLSSVGKPPSSSEGAHGNARISSSFDRSLQPEDDTAKMSVNASMDTDQPMDLTIQACGLDLHSEKGEESGSPRAQKDGNDSDKGNGSLASSSSSSSQSTESKGFEPRDGLSTPLLNDSQLQTDITSSCIESDHLSLLKAGATLHSRYSGVGFVPYKKSMKVKPSSKQEED